MRYTLTTSQIREILAMISQQLFSLLLMILSQQGAIGFFLAPKVKEILRIRDDASSFASKPSGYKDFSSSFPADEKNDNEEESLSISENDLTMFLVQDDDSSRDEQHQGGRFDAFEFFMTQDESIQQLEEDEVLFREELDRIMMVEHQRFIL